MIHEQHCVYHITISTCLLGIYYSVHASWRFFLFFYAKYQQWCGCSSIIPVLFETFLSPKLHGCFWSYIVKTCIFQCMNPFILPSHIFLLICILLFVCFYKLLWIEASAKGLNWKCMVLWRCCLKGSIVTGPKTAPLNPLKRIPHAETCPICTDLT